MEPEEAARAREQHAANQRAYHANLAVQRGRIAAAMCVEGYAPIPVKAFDRYAHAPAVFWRLDSRMGAPLRFERVQVTGSSRPSWSRDFSLWNGETRIGLAEPDAIIFVRTQ